MTESIKYTTKSINLHLTQVVPCNIPIPNCTIYSGCNIIIHQSENSSKIWQFGDNSPYINLPVTFFGEVIMIHPDIYIYQKSVHPIVYLRHTSIFATTNVGHVPIFYPHQKNLVKAFPFWTHIWRTLATLCWKILKRSSWSAKRSALISSRSMCTCAMGQAMGQDMWSVGQIGPVTIHHNWDMEQNLYAFKYNIYTYLYI